MGKKLTALVVLVLVLVVAAAFWRDHRRADRAEMDAGLAASRTLSAVFERTGTLQVARLSGEAVTRVSGSSGFGVFTNVQTTRAPYSVDYLLDLSRLRAADYRWNRAAKVMVVTVPTVTVGKPNIDFAQARSDQSGLYISRKSGLGLQQRAAGNLAAAAGAAAASPANLAKAQAAARDAIAALVASPLAAAGVGEVRVVVRLAGEERPAGLDREQWDMSRPLTEVLRN
ncbi:hypothetical protein [Sphingomonas sp.]|uniref:hypothetical protein n=1 Tax=Sphingomonas sp. TaxID=28214 RepID=UPI003AFF7CB8